MNANRPQLAVEELEDRSVPATWPIALAPGQAPQLLGTYAQYQEVSRLTEAGILDRSIHMHEGIDVPAAAGTAVQAVMAGTVEMIFRARDDTLVLPPVPGLPGGGTVTTTEGMSFIVIRDANGNLGWNYKHVIADPTLRVGQQVTEGMRIGVVSTYEGAPPHAHLDRGESLLVPQQPFGIEWLPPILPAGRFRDPTWETSGPYTGAQNAIRNLEAVITAIDAAAPGIRFAPANVALRTQAVAKMENLTYYLEAVRYQYAPLMNPLATLLAPPAGQAALQDQRKPTVSSLDFRLAADDQYTPAGAGSEIVRTDARYFQNQVTVGNQALVHLGAYATTQAVSGRSTLAGARGGFAGGLGFGPRLNGNIDFVVGAFDNLGAATAQLNPVRFEFSVALLGIIPFASVPSFNFSAFPTYTGVTDFFDASVTRVVYENDWNHNSGLTGPFFYNLTNTVNAQGGGPAGGVVGGITRNHRDLYWNSDAAAGQPFAGTVDAVNNAGAAFPDGIYTITVRAYDLSGNASDPRTVPVLLTNWQRDVRTSQRVYGPNTPITVTGGDQYFGNQNVKLYVLPANPGFFGVPKLVSGTQLAQANLAATVTTNANGQLPNQALGAYAVGSYYVVADYNGDGEYTEGLDAVTVVRVDPPAQAPAPRPAGVGLAVAGAPVQGQSVYLVATVSSADPSFTETPTGAVGFFANGQFLGSAPITGGIAEFDVPGLVAGGHQFVAIYFGDSQFGAVDAEISSMVATNATTTTLTVDAPTAGAGGVMTLTATVTKSATPLTATPSGNVDFYSDGEYMASAPLQSDGTATLLTSVLSRGSHSLTAVYTGDSRFDASESSPAILTVQNSAPVVTGTRVLTQQETPVLVNSLLGASDADGDTLTITDFSQGTNGSVALTDWGFIYTPNAGFVGADTFTYAVDDGHGGTATAVVVVDVYLTDVVVSTNEDTSIVVEIMGGAGFSVLAASNGANGVVTVNADGTLTYTPNANWNGTDEIWYVLGDGASSIVYGNVTVSVAPVNDPPVANDDTAVTYQNMPITIPVLANDTDVDGDALAVTGVTQGTNGTVTFTSTGVTYTPNSNFVGTDSFTYTVSDGHGGTATATVTVTVNSMGGSGGSGGTIGDFVWNDVNQNGIQDPGEYGLYGVTVRLLDGSGNLVATTISDGGGYYSFAGLGAGTYELEFVAPANYAFSPKDQGGNDNTDSDADTITGRTGTFTLSSGQQITNFDAGLYWTGSGSSGGSGSGGYIGDYVWNDMDQDGIQDAGEYGIAGITVYLFDGSNNLIATTVTDWSGHYSFSGLAAGYYQVAFALPSNYVFSPQDQGSDDTIDSDVDLITGRSAVFYLAPDQQYLDLDAGMYFGGSGGSGS